MERRPSRCDVGLNQSNSVETVKEVLSLCVACSVNAVLLQI